MLNLSYPTLEKQEHKNTFKNLIMLVSQLATGHDGLGHK